MDTEQRNIVIDYITDLEKINKELKKENERLKTDYEILIDKMKKDLISELKELIDYSTSPSCTRGMKLFIKRIKNWKYSE